MSKIFDLRFEQDKCFSNHVTRVIQKTYFSRENPNVGLSVVSKVNLQRRLRKFNQAKKPK